MAEPATFWIKEYSPYPAGRTPKDGPANGQTFREEILRPLLADNKQVRIILDGVAGLPSSFLEEVFGGLVRKGIVTLDDFGDRISISATDPALQAYIPLAYRYARDAARSLQ